MDVVRLEKVAPCPPGEFFRQLRDSFVGRKTAVVIVDLKKALGSVDRRVLEKIRGKGISREIVDFFAEFLQGRSFAPLWKGRRSAQGVKSLGMFVMSVLRSPCV